MLKFVVDTCGAKKIALFQSTDTYGMNGAQGIVESVDKYGDSIVIPEKFEATDTAIIPQQAAPQKTIE